ncbi:hypothetical protein Bca101_024392 [Brassica carinata]
MVNQRSFEVRSVADARRDSRGFLFSDLKSGKCSSVVEARLLRSWEARNVKPGGELTSVDMLMVDVKNHMAFHEGDRKLEGEGRGMRSQLLRFPTNPQDADNEQIGCWVTEMNIMNNLQEQMQKAFEVSSTSWCNDKPLRRREEDDEAVMKARVFHDWKDGKPCD